MAPPLVIVITTQFLLGMLVGVGVKHLYDNMEFWPVYLWLTSGGYAQASLPSYATPAAIDYSGPVHHSPPPPAMSYNYTTTDGTTYLGGGYWPWVLLDWALSLLPDLGWLAYYAYRTPLGLVLLTLVSWAAMLLPIAW